MGTDSANNDDDQEKGCDDACDTVEDDHGHCSSWRFAQDIIIAIRARAINGGLIHLDVGLRVLRAPSIQATDNGLGRIGSQHGIHPGESEVVGVLKGTAGSICGVEDDCSRLRVGSKLDGLGRTYCA